MIIAGILMGAVFSLFIGVMSGLIFLPLAWLAEWLFDNLTPWSRLDETVPRLIIIIWITISIFFGMMTGIPTAMIEEAEWGEPVKYVSHEMINLADNNEIEGKFSGRYVRGYIGEKTTYHYYFKTHDGGMELQKASSDNTKIYFTDEKPHADWYKSERTYWWNTETKYYCKIYIPEGSMTTEFAIDME